MSEPLILTCPSPRCGRKFEARFGALSRRGKYKVCGKCGTKEALEDAARGAGKEKKFDKEAPWRKVTVPVVLSIKLPLTEKETEKFAATVLGLVDGCLDDVDHWMLLEDAGLGKYVPEPGSDDESDGLPEWEISFDKPKIEAHF